MITGDAKLLFATRILRLFAYGFLSLQLVLYLASIGIDEKRIGLLLTLTLASDVALSLYLSTRADTMGRRRTLIIGALLMAAAAAVFASTHNFLLLLLAATIGVISPSGNEVGPFLAVEQVALAHVAPSTDRTTLFAWYNLAGSFATALGALASGWVTELLMARGHNPASSYRSVVIAYGLLGILLAMTFARLSRAVEVEQDEAPTPKAILRVEKSRNVVLRLAGLFALDSFAGGLVVQSIVSYWFYVHFGLSPTSLGAIFFGANLLAGISALAAARISRRIGLLNTMVFTHLPSNILLIMVPLMPTLPLAITTLLLRFSISQMDVPARQAYVIAAVDPSERTAAAGITGVARTAGAALAPVLAMPVIAGLHNWVPFVAAGVLKIVYDLGLLAGFRDRRD